MEATFQEIPCPLCGSSTHEALFAREGYAHVRCSDCEFVYVNPQPVDPLGVNAQLYGQDHSTWGEVPRRLSQLGAEELEHEIEAFGKRPARRYVRELRNVERYRQLGTLLDVGCSAGFFLLAAREAGWTVSGVEVAEDQASAGRDLFGLDIRTGTLDGAGLEPESFDVVRANQVIEHIQDPRPFIEAAAALLRPGGVLVLATINFRSLTRFVLGPTWRHLGNERNGHITFFTASTLSRALAEHGLRTVRVETIGVRLANPGARSSRFGRRMRRLAEKALGVVAGPLRLGGRLRVSAVKMAKES